jgi:hypothetical protein
VPPRLCARLPSLRRHGRRWSCAVGIARGARTRVQLRCRVHELHHRPAACRWKPPLLWHPAWRSSARTSKLSIEKALDRENLLRSCRCCAASPCRCCRPHGPLGYAQEPTDSVFQACCPCWRRARVGPNPRLARASIGARLPTRIGPSRRSCACTAKRPISAPRRSVPGVDRGSERIGSKTWSATQRGPMD